MLGEGNWTVVVAVPIVWMVQMAIHQIIDMVTVRYRLVTAAGTVDVVGVMTVTLMIWGAIGGIRIGHF